LNSSEPPDSAASSFDVLDETGEGGLSNAAGRRSEDGRRTSEGERCEEEVGERKEMTKR